MPGTMKMFCIRMNILSHRKNIELFLACKMAAVQNLYKEGRQEGRREGFEGTCRREGGVMSTVRSNEQRKEEGKDRQKAGREELQ